MIRGDLLAHARHALLRRQCAPVPQDVHAAGRVLPVQGRRGPRSAVLIERRYRHRCQIPHPVQDDLAVAAVLLALEAQHSDTLTLGVPGQLRQRTDRAGLLQQSVEAGTALFDPTLPERGPVVLRVAQRAQMPISDAASPRRSPSRVLLNPGLPLNGVRRTSATIVTSASASSRTNASRSRPS